MQKISRALVALAVVTALALTGCSVVSAEPVADPTSTTDPKPAPPVEAPEPAEEPVPVDDMIFAFGETIEYEDGMGLSVSAAVPFTPSQYAAGVDFPTSIVFNITVTNGTDAAYDPLVFGTLSSGGSEASQVYDMENNVGGSPTTAVLPGQSITWAEAWSVADASDLTYSLSPGFEYNDAIFTTIPQ
jgi:hypothetical protein